MTTATTRPTSASAERNAGPILDVLRHELRDCHRVLEIGAGTGQHAVYFAGAMPHLEWQASDLAENMPGIRQWREAANLGNLLPPLPLDVQHFTADAMLYDAVFTANTAHILSMDGVRSMFAVVGQVLRPGGRFCLYGPFRQGAEFNSPSNAAFHRSLRSRDPAMGIRHLEALDELGCEHGLIRARLYAMPANNHLAIWEKNSA